MSGLAPILSRKLMQTYCFRCWSLVKLLATSSPHIFFIPRLMVKFDEHTLNLPQLFCCQSDNHSLIRTEKLPQFSNIVISFSVVGLPDQEASWIFFAFLQKLTILTLQAPENCF
jgi:hypothetical protein